MLSFQSPFRFPLTIVLVGPLLVRVKTVHAQTCNDEISSCVSCLDNGCSWGSGSCVESCDGSGSEPCFSGESFADRTSLEICAIVDSALCLSQNDCSSCVGTIQSDGSRSCYWYELENFCSNDECGASVSCGISTCPNSGTMSPCESCLDSDGSWAIGVCLGSCDEVADVRCYNREGFPDESIAEICQLMENDATDFELCGNQTDCSTCTNTLLADGSSTCSWFEEFEFCSDMLCGQVGCGSLTCPSPVPSNVSTSCEICLDSKGAWAVGTCLGSCSEIADAPCYSSEFFADKSDSEICDIMRANEADSSLCSSQTDCPTCTNTIQSDGTSTCYWYEDDGFCSNTLCGMDTCGASVCTAKSLCESCIKANGGWTSNGYCLVSCDDIETISTATDTTATATTAMARSSQVDDGIDIPEAIPRCYSGQFFPSANFKEICESMLIDETDSILCTNQTDCSTCIETIQSDGIGSCYWFQTQQGQGFCASDMTCRGPYCGLSTCAVTENHPVQVDDPTSEDDPAQALCSNYDDCESCTGANDACYWSEGMAICQHVECNGEGNCGTSSCPESSSYCKNASIQLSLVFLTATAIIVHWQFYFFL